MAFSYTVPLSVFSDLFEHTDRALHPELAERLRVEIHADIARRLSGPGLLTAMGPQSTPFDSMQTGDDLVFYGENLTGPRDHLTAAPRQGREMARGLGANQKGRYPDPALAGGAFAAAVNSVLASSFILRREFEDKSERLRMEAP